ncbi:unnamed protein product [Brachionus calyciflorus]|uniref:Troponin T n=1 Tax=Brachionus calyciflorus TaxID=104777 RepID=A0A813Q2E5_9BILA|nr:unnamed protein product [Brachionus calyciflorus]
MADNEDQEFVKTRALKSTAKSEAEIEAAIRAEIEREEDEIEMLRAKAEERRRRQEEAAQQEAERAAQIEAEKRKREEEERRRKEELLQKKRQQELAKLEEEKRKLEKEMASTIAGGSKLSNILKAKEDMLKSPEQLEQEKRETIASRLVKLRLDGQNKDDLIRQAEEFYQVLIELHSQIYDLNEKYDRQKYDMMELAERARQIEKGKAKTRKSNIVHTGLGGSVFNWVAEQNPHAPQKISLFSRYERVTDRRTFKDRRELWASPKEQKSFAQEKPKAKIRNVEGSSNNEYNRKPRKPRQEEQHEEEHHEEEDQHHEEEHHEEEEQHEEEHHEEQEEEQADEE